MIPVVPNAFKMRNTVPCSRNSMVIRRWGLRRYGKCRCGGRRPRCDSRRRQKSRNIRGKQKYVYDLRIQRVVYKKAGKLESKENFHEQDNKSTTSKTNTKAKTQESHTGL